MHHHRMGQLFCCLASATLLVALAGCASSSTSNVHTAGSLASTVAPTTIAPTAPPSPSSAVVTSPIYTDSADGFIAGAAEFGQTYQFGDGTQITLGTPQTTASDFHMQITVANKTPIALTAGDFAIGAYANSNDASSGTPVKATGAPSATLPVGGTSSWTISWKTSDVAYSDNVLIVVGIQTDTTNHTGFMVFFSKTTFPLAELQ